MIAACAWCRGTLGPDAKCACQGCGAPWPKPVRPADRPSPRERFLGSQGRYDYGQILESVNIGKPNPIPQPDPERR